MPALELQRTQGPGLAPLETHSLAALALKFSLGCEVLLELSLPLLCKTGSKQTTQLQLGCFNQFTSILKDDIFCDGSGFGLCLKSAAAEL